MRLCQDQVDAYLNDSQQQLKPIEYNIDCFELKDETKSNFKNFRKKIIGDDSKDQSGESIKSNSEIYDSEDDDLSCSEQSSCDHEKENHSEELDEEELEAQKTLKKLKNMNSVPINMVEKTGDRPSLEQKPKP